jgi:hypothetical protein
LTDHAYLRSMQGRREDAEAMMRIGFRLQRGDRAEDDRTLAPLYVVWAATRARAGDADGAIEKLRAAVRSGATEEDAGHYREIAALRSRTDYPLESSR